MFELTPQESQWLENFNRRKELWQGGAGACPLAPTFRRYELPQAHWIGGAVPFEVLDQLDRVDPQLEIIFDKFTVVGGSNSAGPGHHLVTNLNGPGQSSGDLLSYECSLQWDIDPQGGIPLWPRGRPAPPGLWFIPFLRKHYVGFMGGDNNPVRRRKIERSKENAKEFRARSIKKAIDTELAINDEILPYLPAIVGGKNKTIRRTGRQLIPGAGV